MREPEPAAAASGAACASELRLSLGQWFTPVPVADLALALALEGRGDGARVLDPACGDGVFLARARAAGAAHVAGVEIDAAAAAAAAARVTDAAVTCADVFELAPAGAGYDAVVGNPPYVRQERLDAVDKRRIRARLAADWPDLAPAELDRLVGRGDLAVAVLARALRLARPGGRLAFVVSSALLDATYAQPLWRLVAAHGRVLAVIDAPGERWFHDAAVNPVIVVIERGPSAAAAVRLARLAVTTAEAARRVRGVADLDAVAEVRLGGPDPGSWPALLRAPGAWFALREAAGDALVPLGAVAELRRGATSGANDLFYVSRARAVALGLERAALRPLVRAPDRSIAVDPGASRELAIVVPADEDALARLPVTRRYFERHAAAAARPTLRARRPWWALPAVPARVFFTKAYGARFVQQLAPVPCVADQRVYALTPRAGLSPEALAAALNTTYTALALEALGRASMGEGALEWTVADARALPIPDPRRLGADALAALASVAGRAIGPAADEVQRPDRRALDAAAAPALAPYRDAVAVALAASVARRVGRATATPL